jgi:hypothetical protein
MEEFILVNKLRKGEVFNSQRKNVFVDMTWPDSVTYFKLVGKFYLNTVHEKNHSGDYNLTSMAS